MSDWTARNPYPDRQYQETCDYCGCIFEVETQKQDGHNEHEEYFCPECGKEYGEWACITPRVTLISRRTDGRTCKYPGGLHK